MAGLAALMILIAVYRRGNRNKSILRAPHSGYGTMDTIAMGTITPSEAAGVVPTTYRPATPERQKRSSTQKMPPARGPGPRPPARDYDADLLCFLAGVKGADKPSSVPETDETHPYRKISRASTEAEASQVDGKQAWIAASNAESKTAWSVAHALNKSSSSSGSSSGSDSDSNGASKSRPASPTGFSLKAANTDSARQSYNWDASTMSWDGYSEICGDSDLSEVDSADFDADMLHDLKLSAKPAPDVSSLVEWSAGDNDSGSDAGPGKGEYLEVDSDANKSDDNLLDITSDSQYLAVGTAETVAKAETKNSEGQSEMPSTFQVVNDYEGFGFLSSSSSGSSSSLADLDVVDDVLRV